LYKINEYKVVDGDNLQSIADKYNVTKDTIKWANMDKFGTYDAYNSEFVRANDILHIPEVPGVLYTIKDGDTLDSIVQKASGDKQSVIDINQLASAELTGRTYLLIPNGKLPAPAAPPPTIPTFFYRPPPAPGDCNTNSSLGSLNGVTFSNPLCHPSCGGYIETRGVNLAPGPYYHDGVDLAKAGGCPVRAACDGEVYYAGWGSPGGINYGEGYNVGIDCGNGVKTVYYHSDGNIWVSKGDHVSKGQDIMYMGCSGNCSGTHLHFGLKLNGGVIGDPEDYVPF